MVRTTDVTPCTHCYQNSLQNLLFARATAAETNGFPRHFLTLQKIHPCRLSIECTRQILEQIIYKVLFHPHSFTSVEDWGMAKHFGDDQRQESDHGQTPIPPLSLCCERAEAPGVG